MRHFADRLADAVRTKRSALCVGIDPRVELLPRSIRQKHDTGTLQGQAGAIEEFSLRILDLVYPHVPAIKLQSAFFELCGADGFAAQGRILKRAHELDLLTILDSKRGDIASTAVAYAQAAFSVWQADSLTVNPYLGSDAIAPFLQLARTLNRAVFVLVRTSNPGSGLFQNLDCKGRPLYQHVADSVRIWNQENLGSCGFGDVGAVVGATHPEELGLLRTLLPDVWFLIPGYGAQGGQAENLAAAFTPAGLGALINSSRGITFPFHPDETEWERAVMNATLATIGALQSVLPA